MKLVFLLLLFLLGGLFPAQDTARVKHIHEDFSIKNYTLKPKAKNFHLYAIRTIFLMEISS